MFFENGKYYYYKHFCSKNILKRKVSLFSQNIHLLFRIYAQSSFDKSPVCNEPPSWGMEITQTNAWEVLALFLMSWNCVKILTDAVSCDAVDFVQSCSTFLEQIPFNPCITQVSSSSAPFERAGVV